MISNRWKILAAVLPIIGTCAFGQPQPGGLGGFFSAVWGAYNKFVVTYLTEDLAQDNDLTIYNDVVTNFVSAPPFASSSADLLNRDGFGPSSLNATAPTGIVTNQPWTGEIWANIDNYSSSFKARISFFNLYSSVTKFQNIDYRNGAGNINWRLDNNVYFTDYALSTGTWYHIAWVENQTNRLLYIDGVPVHTNTMTYTFDLDPTIFIIGNLNPGASTSQPFEGQLSEARLWNYARSDAEILNNYNKRMRGDEPGLVGYWPLNEGNL